MAVLVHKSLHGSAPSYLTNIFTPLSTARHRAHPSSASHQLLVPCCWLSTIGDRAFPVAGAIVGNSLPPDVTSFPTLAYYFPLPPKDSYLIFLIRAQLFNFAVPSICCFFVFLS
jgi:hypothetical protein